jgi:hypothetical protein
MTKIQEPRKAGLLLWPARQVIRSLYHLKRPKGLKAE